MNNIDVAEKSYPQKRSFQQKEKKKQKKKNLHILTIIVDNI